MSSIQSALWLLSSLTFSVTVIWVSDQEKNNEGDDVAEGEEEEEEEEEEVRLKEDDMREDEMTEIWVVVRVKDEDEVKIEIGVILRIELSVGLPWPERKWSNSILCWFTL